MPTRGLTVGTSSTPLLAYNNRRTAASFQNNGSAVIFVSEDQTDITGQGYPIQVGGALDLIRAFGDEPYNQWFAEVAADTQNMRVLEAFGQLPPLETPPFRISAEEARNGGG